jgi:hypothetical protein
MHVDGATFNRNVNDFPLEELAKYAGRWVAWNGEGTAILASSDRSPDEVVEQLVRAGIDPQECVHDYIPGLDEVHLGGL